MKSLLPLTAALGLLAAATARADVGAFSVDLGGGVALVRTPATYAEGSPGQTALAPVIWLDARYAWSNQLELTGSAFFETGASFSVADATVPTGTGSFVGTLQFKAKRFGALAGARAVRGSVWRLLVGAELGLSLTSFSGAQLVNSSGQDVGLHLADSISPSVVVAPSGGVAWVGDRLTVALVPRAELLVGSSVTWALVVPLTIGWDFYFR